MILKQPFIITPRLMPGVQIGEAFISIGAGHREGSGRTRYKVFIDLPDGSSHEVTDLRSGCQGGGIQEGMVSLLAFLGAAASAYSFRMSGRNSDNDGLFNPEVTEWAYQNSDEISMLECEINESECLIEYHN